MHIDKIAKRFLSFVLIAFAVCTLSACFDLGNGTADDDDYREVYSTVKLIGSDSSVENYFMSDFYSEETVNEFKCPIASGNKAEYAYVAISIGRDLELGEVVVFFDSDEDVNLGVTFFLTDDVPSVVYNGDDGDCDADESDEPSDELSVGKTNARLTKNKWKEVSLGRWSNADGESAKRLSVSAGQYLILRIDNNTYSSLEKEYVIVKKEVDDLQAAFNEKTAVLKSLVDNSAGSAEIAAARLAVEEAQSALDEGKSKLREVETRQPYLNDGYERVKIRMTNILIYAERG